MKNYLPFFAAFFLLGLSACEKTPSEKQQIEGVWASLGYGKIIQIEGEQYAFYDVTKISCLPDEQGSLNSFGGDLSLKNDTLQLVKGISSYYYTRIDDLPDLCKGAISESQKQNPEYNFAVFANTIEEHFAYFKRNKINWDSLHQIYKSQVTATTSEPELYLILDEMLSALKDNHGYLEPSDSVYEQALLLEKEEDSVPKETPQKEYGDLTIAQIAAEHYLDEDLTRDSRFMTWGKIKDHIAYIQVKTMWLYADFGIPDSLIQKNGFVDPYLEASSQMTEAEYVKKEVEGVRALLDRILKDLKDTHYLILDVRFNGGGQDAVSREILRRFNSSRTPIAAKKAVHKAAYTTPTTLYMEGSDNTYQKPVFLLTSQQSASATDFMALASLELPNVKRIGMHTNGALSDAMEKTLPNGWYFSISNEIYTDLKGNCYESIGIPVDYELGYPEDRQTFFRLVANDLAGDKAKVLQAIETFDLQ